MKARREVQGRCAAPPPRERPRAREADALPDARDGLNRLERAILTALAELQRERAREWANTAMLYGRVVERVDVSQREFLEALQKLVGAAVGGRRAR